MYRSSHVEIDLKQFRANLAILRSHVSAEKTLLVVKGNAYGHGTSAIAQEAQAAGVDMLGAATISEAAEIQSAGVTLPVLVICALDVREIDYCVEHNIHFMAWRADQFRAAAESAQKYNTKPNIHLEIDTGMHRSGVTPENLANLLDNLTDEDKSNIVAVMSHFHSSGLEECEPTLAQIEQLTSCREVISQAGISAFFHTTNSSGTIKYPQAHFGMVRLGVGTYGIAPSDSTAMPEGIDTFMKWTANITNVLALEPGQGVGYGWKHIAERQETIATIGVGYADGYRRMEPGVNTVLIQGIEATVAGTVMMDQMCIIVPDSVEVSVGDVVTLLGKDGQMEITPKMLATKWDTNTYSVVSGIRNRIPRRYVNGIAVADEWT